MPVHMKTHFVKLHYAEPFYLCYTTTTLSKQKMETAISICIIYLSLFLTVNHRWPLLILMSVIWALTLSIGPSHRLNLENPNMMLSQEGVCRKPQVYKAKTHPCFEGGGKQMAVLKPSSFSILSSGQRLPLS